MWKSDLATFYAEVFWPSMAERKPTDVLLVDSWSANEGNNLLQQSVLPNMNFKVKLYHLVAQARSSFLMSSSSGLA
ncbi:hypothetical protein ANN_09459 [Periplaneta americana]|uniref:Uncharacterized protein n=1 Tax=Periplaneta americana TaxID=6978 RepID=A0ABQ8TNY0_PERAM|nr:hypothetical protein ANN_09459 [Periplaneta americana]